MITVLTLNDMVIFTLAIFGLIIGSFLNVYILRLNTGKDTTGRSACASCGSKLEVIDLIPVLSFLFLKGRCRKCKSRISFQYPLVELVTAAGFVLIYIYNPLRVVYALPVLFFLFATSVVIATYDIKHHIIPQKLIYFLAIAVAVAFFATLYLHHSLYHLADYFSAFLSVSVFSFPIFLIWFVSKGRGMGFADVKLSAVLFWLMDWEKSWTAFTVAFVVGALWGLAMLAYSKIKHKGVSLKTEIAFGPFILLAFWVVYLSGISIYDIIRII